MRKFVIKTFAQRAKFVVILFLVALVSGSFCGCMYRPDIQQGNVITQKMASQLHLGMSQAAAKRILGEPLLVNVFANNRLDYVYTYQHKRQPMTERQIILTFKNDRLVHIIKKLG